MRRLHKICLIVAFSLFVAACEEDVVVKDHNQTTDITLERSEQLAWAAMNGTFYPHFYSALYTYLDISDLPLDAFYAAVEDHYFASCIKGGAFYTHSKARDEYRKGDSVTVEYQGCELDNGVVYDGMLRATYKDIRGLNRQFVEIDTDACVASLEREYSELSRVIRVSGTELRLEASGEFTLVIVDDVEVDAVPRSESAIVVNDYPDVGATADLADEVYTVIDLVAIERACQSYVRKLTVTLESFASSIGDHVYTLDGTMTIYESTDDLNTFIRGIDDSKFMTYVQQGGRESEFSMRAYSVEQTVNLGLGTYAYRIDGEVTSDDVYGVVGVSVSENIDGYLDEPTPINGTLRVLGRGIEQIGLDMSEFTLTMLVDDDGDTNGDTFPDFNPELTFQTTWDQLLSRDFIYTEE